jgi:DNA-binding transcriptional LysR family regulator
MDILSLVAAGFGVTIMPSSVRRISRKGLALRPIVGSPRTDLFIAWRTDDASPALREFISFVQIAFAKMDSKS